MAERVRPDPLPPRPIDQLQDIPPLPFGTRTLPTEPASLIGTLFGEAVAASAASETAVDARTIRHMASYQVIGACIQAEASTYPSERTFAIPSLSALSRHMSMVPRQPTVLLRAVSEQAALLSPKEAMGHMLEQLEGFTHYLATGEQPARWPHTALYDELLTQKSIADVQSMAAIVRHAIEPLRRYDHAAATNYASRYHEWLTTTCDLLLSQKCIGIAVPLINTARESEGPFVLRRLQQAMAAVREEQDANAYRRTYSQVYHALTEPWRSDFVRHNPRLPAGLMAGSRREIVQWNDSSTLIEHYAVQQVHSARLARGQSIELPYTDYHERTFTQYDTPAETEGSGPQQKVPYTHLGADARHAIAKAARSYGRGGPSLLVPACYKRLALRKQTDSDATLHTVRFRPGVRRSVSVYPDDGGRKYHPAHHMLEGQVIDVEFVCDDYLIMPYRGGDPAQATFSDRDPNFFGPGAAAANAFWISGRPRTVIDASGHPERMQASRNPRMRDTPRWVIVPVRYFRIDAPDARLIRSQ